MPFVAHQLPLPRRYAAHGLRRYGFHGLSYTYLLEELGRRAGLSTMRGRVILPHLAIYLLQTEGLTPKQFDHLINHESGLLGVSETSSDMRDLLAAQATDHRAAEAVALLFCYQTRKWLGSFAAVLGGLDILVFSGGILNASAIKI